MACFTRTYSEVCNYVLYERSSFCLLVCLYDNWSLSNDSYIEAVFVKADIKQINYCVLLTVAFFIARALWKTMYNG